MAVVKSRKFDAALAAALVTDIQFALAGVALKYKVDLLVGETPKIGDREVVFGLTAEMPRSSMMSYADDAKASKDEPTDRIAAFMAALPDAHAEHFPHLSLKMHYRNGEHTYKIVGYNKRAHKHPLLMQNVATDEYFRMPIDQVSEFKRVRAKAKKA
jgi:hypothetical protein